MLTILNFILLCYLLFLGAALAMLDNGFLSANTHDRLAQLAYGDDLVGEGVIALHHPQIVTSEPIIFDAMRQVHARLVTLGVLDPKDTQGPGGLSKIVHRQHDGAIIEHIFSLDDLGFGTYKEAIGYTPAAHSSQQPWALDRRWRITHGLKDTITSSTVRGQYDLQTIAELHGASTTYKGFERFSGGAKIVFPPPFSTYKVQTLLHHFERDQNGTAPIDTIYGSTGYIEATAYYDPSSSPHRLLTQVWDTHGNIIKGFDQTQRLGNIVDVFSQSTARPKYSPNLVIEKERVAAGHFETRKVTFIPPNQPARTSMFEWVY